ncbi:MAG: hypothetical protein VKK32_01345 [Candidatus Melainabacteria bacterium]|nr:hypothetical protein [Candidatus Melainabacteria bacterium]
MSFDFLSCFGNTTTNCEINLGTLKVDTDDIKMPPAELPEPEIKPDPVVIKDTFQSSSGAELTPTPPVTDSTIVKPKQPENSTTPITDTFQLNSNNQNPSNIFTQPSTIDWSKVTWEVSDISIDAFKLDINYSAKFIESNNFLKDDTALQLAFADSEINFTDFFISDKFTDYENGDGKWSYAEMKNFERKLTELDAKGQLTPEQKKGLESLRKESSQIEAIVNEKMKSGSNIDPNSIIDSRLKNGGQGFYDNLTKLSNTVKEQEARNSAAKIASENIFIRDTLAKENKSETRINELADKLIKNDYSSKEAKQKDLDEFMKLYTELGKAEKLEMKDTGIFDRIMNKMEIQTAIKNSIDESQKNFLDRYKELKERERSGNISVAEKETLQKMEEQKNTILALQKRIKDNPEEAYKYYQELMFAYADAGDYKKAAGMVNGKVTAIDTADIQEKIAQTETEKKAAKVYTNVLVSDSVLRKRNKVDNNELNSRIKLQGSLDKFQQEYRLSNDVTAGIKSEMRSLYTSDQNTYNKYYNNSSSDYSSNYENSGVPRPGSPEFHALTQEDQRLILGQLNTKIAEEDAIKELIAWGIPRNIAIAIVTNNTLLLKEKTQEMSNETASKYLSLAGLKMPQTQTPIMKTLF